MSYQLSYFRLVKRNGAENIKSVALFFFMGTTVFQECFFIIVLYSNVMLKSFFLNPVLDLHCCIF